MPGPPQTSSTHADEAPAGPIRAVKATLGACVAVLVVLLAFAWPTYTAKVKDMPVAVVGSQQQVEAFEARLGTQATMLDVVQVPNRAAAQEKITLRETYGAIVLPTSPAEPTTTFLTASAAGGGATQVLNQMAAQMRAAQAQAGSAPHVEVVDVVPLAATDSRGTGFGIAGLPLAMGGMIGGALISMLVHGARLRLASVAAYGVLGGLGLTGVLQSWFGFIHGPFLTNWTVIGTTLAATGALITGLHSVLGQKGIALGAVLTMLVGNPISSITMPKEWLPGAWGEIGQFFVPGAAGNLLRSVSYFPDAATTRDWLVLATWLLLGLALTMIGHRDHEEPRAEADDAQPASIPEPVKA